jgi:hypothetical protein
MLESATCRSTAQNLGVMVQWCKLFHIFYHIMITETLKCFVFKLEVTILQSVNLFSGVNMYIPIHAVMLVDCF